jgi:Fe-S cluster assembly scaffold protein SufB
MAMLPDADITLEEQQQLTPVGYSHEGEHSGTCVLVNQEVRHIAVNHPDVEILPLKDALDRYDWVQDLMFNLIDPAENEHVAQAAESRHAPVGHFIRIRKGAKVPLPVQVFTLLETPQGRQFHHNITVIEEGAQVDMISGSAVPPAVHAGHHLSISETYLREGATCRSVSIERWGSAMEVHSYARTHIGRNARAIESNIQVSSLKRHYSQSRTIVEEGGVANDQSVIFAPHGTERIMENEIRLAGTAARSDSITRMVTGGGSISNRTTLIGEGKDSRGFLGCNGLKLSDEGEILSVPALLARSAEAQLSHEASIGMIAQDKLSYLMASGMSEDTARDLIIQGFLNLDAQQLPEAIRVEVSRTIAAANTGSM